VLATNQRTLAEIAGTIRCIGGAIGRATAAESLAREFMCDLETLRTDAEPRPRVYFEEWPDPMISGIGWVGELIEWCGGEDIFAARRGRAARDRTVEPQEIITANPDMILASWCGKHVDLDSIRQRPGFHAIAALQRGGLHALDSNILLQPGPRILEGARVLHDLFKDWRQSRVEALAT
jgi:iron complex transport system substrate-binding protein